MHINQSERTPYHPVVGALRGFTLSPAEMDEGLVLAAKLATLPEEMIHVLREAMGRQVWIAEELVSATMNHDDVIARRLENNVIMLFALDRVIETHS
jgi:hypothetical protein